jgi:hypothetical protein
VRSYLYRITGLCVIAILASSAQAAAPAPKKRSGPRALAVIRWQPDAQGKAVPYLVPFAVLVEGRFYDANIYLASPRPLAVEPGNIYEAQDLGQILGLFTVERAVEVAGSGARNWLGFGRWENQSPLIDFPVSGMVNSVPVPPAVAAQQPPEDDDDVHKKTKTTYDESGRPIEDSKDEEPVRDKRGRMEPIERMPVPAADKKAPPAAAKPDDDPDRPKYKRPAGTTTPPSTTPEPEAKAAPAVTVAPVASSAPGGPIRSDEDPNRPRLKRGAPASAREEKPEPSGGGPVPERVRERGARQSAKGPVYEAAAFSDADTAGNKQFFRYSASEDERAALEQKMMALAEQELARALAPPEPGGAAPARKAAPRPGARAAPRMALQDVRIQVMDVDSNNSPEAVLTARYDRPGAAAVYLALVARAVRTSRLRKQPVKVS